MNEYNYFLYVVVPKEMLSSARGNYVWIPNYDAHEEMLYSYNEFPEVLELLKNIFHK